MATRLALAWPVTSASYRIPLLVCGSPHGAGGASPGDQHGPPGDDYHLRVDTVPVDPVGIERGRPGELPVAVATVAFDQRPPAQLTPAARRRRHLTRIASTHRTCRMCHEHLTRPPVVGCPPLPFPAQPDSYEGSAQNRRDGTGRTGSPTRLPTPRGPAAPSIAAH